MSYQARGLYLHRSHLPRDPLHDSLSESCVVVVISITLKCGLLAGIGFCGIFCFYFHNNLLLAVDCKYIWTPTIDGRWCWIARNICVYFVSLIVVIIRRLLYALVMLTLLRG